jgi:Flp pilus assembly protein TadG
MTPERRRATERDRGAILLEAALIMPLLVVLFLGIIEYGMAFRRANTVSSALGTSSQEVAREIGQRTTDYLALEQVRDTFSASYLTTNVRWVMVYRTSATDGAPPEACMTAAASLTSGSTGVLNTCNIYSGAAISTYTAADFDHPDCSGEPDAYFCPAGRGTVVGDTERVGVAIRFFHPFISGLFGRGLTITDRAVAVPNRY